MTDAARPGRRPGLIVALFMPTLSAMGAIYLFNDELNDLVYPRQPHARDVRYRK